VKGNPPAVATGGFRIFGITHGNLRIDHVRTEREVDHLVDRRRIGRPRSP
jgi:hypothetical protein